MELTSDLWQRVWTYITMEEPRAGLHSIPGTKPVTIEALLLPPVMYYIALLFLPHSTTASSGYHSPQATTVCVGHHS